MRVDRRWWAAMVWAAVASLALLGAYAAALARLPQQRAALEALIRAQTGFDVRFGSISLRLGLYGPEAHFTGVTLSMRGSPRPLLQATELVARFETWRMLRGGALRPGRILVVGARINARELREAAARRGATRPPAPAATPEQRWLWRLTALARSLPAGRLEFESATLHGVEASAANDAGRAIRIPRLAIERGRGQARVHGTALLAEPFGRSLYLALELRGLDAAAEALEGTLIAQGRALRIAGWQSLLGSVAAEPPAGVADLRVVLWLRGGRVQSGGLTLAGRDLSFVPRGTAQRARVRYLAGSAALRRTAAGWTATGSDLRLESPSAAAGSLSWKLQVDPDLREGSLQLPEAPLAWLQPLAGLPADLRFAGTLRDLELAWDRDAETRWRYALHSDDAAWLDARGTPRLAPLAFTLRGDGSAARLELLASDALLALPAPAGVLPEDAPEPWPMSARGRIDVVRSAAGWRLTGDALQVARRESTQLRPRFELDATLDAADSGTASLDVAVRVLEPASSAELPWLGDLAARMFLGDGDGGGDGAGDSRLGEFALAGGRFALRAERASVAEWRLRDSRGELAVSSASIRADPRWPALTEAGGRLRWDARGLRFDVERGEVGGLRLLRGALERGATPRWTFSLEGPVDAALEALRASPLGTRLPRELARIDLSGRARFELSLGGARRASTPPAVPRWTLSARFDALRWRPLEDVAAVERLAGTVRLADGALLPMRLDATWFGRPMRIAFEPRRAAPRWRLSGQWPAALLADLLGDGQGEGNAAADGDRVPALRDAYPWRIEAQPLGAAADRWRIEASVAGQRLRALLEARAAAEGGFEIARGTVQLGPAAAVAAGLQLPDAAELRVAGTVARAELVGLAAAWAGAGPALARWPPLAGGVAIDTFSVLGEPVGAAALGWGPAAPPLPAGALWLRGPAIEGHLPRLANAASRPQVELARLQLARPPGRAALRSTQRDAEWSSDVSIESLRVSGRTLGAVQARLVATPQRFALEDVRWRVAQLRIAGDLDCLRRELRCDARAELSGGGARAALAAWGIESGFDAAGVAGTVQLSWPVTEPDDAWAALDGELRLSARDGELAAPVALALVEPGPRSWPWQDLALEGRIGAGRVDISRLTLDGEQQLSLAGTVGLPEGATQLQGYWYPERPMPRALERWPAAPAIAALWRGMRGEAAPPRPVAVSGRVDALEMQRPPLQSAPAP